jgi:farnesyl-diphosphate farnesyltransferase
MTVPISPTEHKLLFHDILKGVSRSFYLTLRVLPDSLQEPVALAYLLARAADTLADTTVLPQSDRLHYLHCFKGYITNPRSADACDTIQSILQDSLSNRDEARLLAMLPQLFALFAAQPEPDRGLIRGVVTTLTDGMVFDLQAFPAEESGEVKALPKGVELDRYTYLVAGCVGEFWTAISMAHVEALSHWDRQRVTGLGIRFGKALQLTNILRDLPRDLRIGRCYLPQEWLDQHRLSIADLMDDTNSDRAHALLQQGIALALQHYEAALEYLLAIPRRCMRLRLAALWPLMIGLATLEKLAVSREWLDVNTIIKVERWRVYSMLLKSFLVIFSNNLIKRWLRNIYS